MMTSMTKVDFIGILQVNKKETEQLLRIILTVLCNYSKYLRIKKIIPVIHERYQRIIIPKIYTSGIAGLEDGYPLSTSQVQRMLIREVTE